MRTRKLVVSMGLACSLVFLVGFSSPYSMAKEKYEQKFEKTVQLDKKGKVWLRNISGEVEVKTWNKAEVKIDALKVSTGSSLAKAKENVEKVKIQVEKEGDVLRIKTDYPEHKFKSFDVSVNYNLTVPSLASLELNTVSGNVDVEKAGGKVEVEVVSGDIVIRGADDRVECKTVSGDIVLQQVKGNVYSKTVSGNVEVRGVRGSLEVETVSGDLKMEEVSSAQDIKAKTLSGETFYQGEFREDGHYSFKSHSGDIHLNIPASSSFSLEASTFSGEIDCDFEIVLSGKISKKEIKGTVNKGGAEVKLSTFSGDMHVKKK